MLQKHSILHASIRKYGGPAIAAAAALLLGGNTASAAADEIYSARTQITLPGGQLITAFDISFVDPVIGLYFLADRTNNAVEEIDTTFNDSLVQLGKGLFAGVATTCATGNVNDCSGPDGVVTVNHREVWAGDGNSTIKVIDLFTQTLKTTINTGGKFRADELCFDPRDQLVLMANDAESPPFVTIVSTKSYGVLATIPMNGVKPAPLATNGIEQCQWDHRTGLFYVNIPEVAGPGNDTAPGAVVTISPTTLAIDKVYSIPLSKCAGPQGMAIGPDNQILLGCNNPNKTVPSTVIIDDKTGKVIETIANQDGSDEVWYNDGNGSYFLARSGGANPQKLGIIDVDADPGPSDQDVATGLAGKGAAHSVAADPIFNQIYVPIPSTAGLAVCSLAGGSDAQGCIAVFTSTAPDDPGIP